MDHTGKIYQGRRGLALRRLNNVPQLLHLSGVPLEVPHGLVDNTFYKLAATFDLPHEHGALNDCQAKVGELTWICV